MVRLRRLVENCLKVIAVISALGLVRQYSSQRTAVSGIVTFKSFTDYAPVPSLPTSLESFSKPQGSLQEREGARPRLPRNTTVWDISKERDRIARRDCAQRHLFAAFGLDTLHEYFVMGCDSPALWDFQRWAEESGCGSEPVDGMMLIHTAWAGPYEHVVEDLVALMDSFLATQDTKHTKFIFWLIDADYDSNDLRFQAKYQGAMGGAIEFRRANLVDFVGGTAMSRRSEFIDMDWSKIKKGPRWKANLFRMLILHKLGGVWVDTDTVLLRDIRPLFEFTGEFATKLTMSLYYNNNVLGLRAGSALGAEMIKDIVETPDPTDERQYCKYVTQLGGQCYPKWTWNHGIIQLAVKRGTGIVTIPTQYTDPGYACYPVWLLSKSGGMRTNDFTLDETLDFIRGSFVLHTRAYGADKPINPDSNFGRLYRAAAASAARGLSAPISLVKIEPRTRSEAELFAANFARHGYDANSVDPSFVPTGRKQYVMLRPTAREFRGRCIDALRSIKGQMFGGNPELRVMGDCKRTEKKFNESVVWIWHPESGCDSI